MGDRAETYREIPHLGAVRGERVGRAMAFRGIPYAEPPTGTRRFAPPVPVAPWRTTLDATRPARIAPQLPSLADTVMGPIGGEQDENCLTLTIWTPAEPFDRAPVMVWLHGGGFVTGGGAVPWYDGAHLAAAHGVVVVGVNYRLGALGFLAIADRIPPNLALLDQQLALDWIAQHIASFGGDPDRVTAFGQSGGGHNIASHLASDRQPRFRRAILQSTPFGIGLSSLAESTKRAEPFLQALGLHAAQPDLAERLRDLPIDRILAAQSAAGRQLAGQAKGDLRPPVLPAEGPPHAEKAGDLAAAAAEGAIRHGVELMVGWTRDETDFFMRSNPHIAAMDSVALDQVARQTWGELAPALLDRLSKRFPDVTPGQLFSAAVTEVNFRDPALEFAARVEKAGGRIFVYQFDWKSPASGLGACHCIDLPMVFGSRKAWVEGRMLNGADDAAVDRLSESVQRRWVGFAAGGDPGFPAWSRDARPVLHIDTEDWIEFDDIPPPAIAPGHSEVTGA